MKTDSLATLMQTRFSCRAYKPDPVPDDVIHNIIELARRAASWSNIQPWDNMIITRPETTKRLSAALLAADAQNPAGSSDIPYPESYPEAHMARRREVGFGLYKALGIAREDRKARHEHHLRNFKFFDAPHVALLSVPKVLGVYGVLDIGAFVSSFLLAAHSQGVGSVAQAALALQSPTIHTFFDLPEDVMFVCGISFGYADPENPANKFRSSRISSDQIFTFR